MDNRMKEIQRMLKENALSPQDTFEFGCDRCGKCCRNRNDILLNPMDVYRMAKYLKLTPQALIDTYCNCYQGGDSRIVVIHLLPKEYRKTCPFLTKDGCSIHEAKPTVCAIYPLGRGIAQSGEHFTYFTQAVECGRKGEYHTVEDWLRDFHLLNEEADGIAWMNIVEKYTLAMHRVEKHLARLQVEYLLKAMYFFFYLNYDTKAPFSSQFAANSSAMEQVFKKVTGKELVE